MRSFKPFILFILVTMFGVANASNIEHRIWNKQPLDISLPVNQERIISFPGEVSIDVPADIKAASRIQIRSDGTIYWKAGRDFAKRRVIVRSKLGRVYLLNVSATIDAPDHQVTIIDEIIERKHKIIDNNNNYQPELKKNVPAYDYVDLFRYASQNLYAPKRLIKQIDGITRFPVISNNYPLYRGQRITLVPVVQWKTNSIPSLYVTALAAHNSTQKLIDIDVRNIRGKWLARSSQHGALGPNGSKTQSTTVYLISDKPFQEAIQ